MPQSGFGGNVTGKSLAEATSTLLAKKLSIGQGAGRDAFFAYYRQWDEFLAAFCQ